MSRRTILVSGVLLLVTGAVVAVSAQEKPEEPKKEQTFPALPGKAEARLDCADKLDRLGLAIGP